MAPKLLSEKQQSRALNGDLPGPRGRAQGHCDHGFRLPRQAFRIHAGCLQIGVTCSDLYFKRIIGHRAEKGLVMRDTEREAPEAIVKLSVRTALYAVTYLPHHHLLAL